MFRAVPPRHGSCSFRLVPTREDEFDRCVTDLGLRAARERIREREVRCEGQNVFSGMAAEKKPLDRILELRSLRNRFSRLIKSKPQGGKECPG